MGRRILVTGGTGFVGRHLLPALDALLDRDDRIVATGHQAAEEGGGRVSFRTLDLLDREQVEGAVGALRPTHTLHLAAFSSVHQAFAEPAQAWRVNVCGTLALAEAVRRHAPGGVFVMVSTAEVYGRSFRSGVPLVESDPLQPANPYARSKAAAESLVLDVLEGHAHVVVLRPVNQTGPGQDERFVVPALAAQVARIEAGLADPVLRVGNLDAERDFLDVRDAVRAYARATLDAGALPRPAILNLSSGVPRRIADVLEALRRRARRDFEVVTDPSRLRPTDIPRAVASPEAIRLALGWAPERPFEETLAAVLDDWRARVAETP